MNLKAAVSCLLLVLLVVYPAMGQKDLILDVYVDSGGRVLISGYSQNLEGLQFLQGSQYTYDNQTYQLYAITDLLTRKEGEQWILQMSSSGDYQQYHTVVYLPVGVQVTHLNLTSGLDYMVYVTNDSLVVDVSGHDVLRPVMDIEYMQAMLASPLKETEKTGNDVRYLALVLVIALGGGLFLFFHWPGFSFARKGALGPPGSSSIEKLPVDAQQMAAGSGGSYAVTEGGDPGLIDIDTVTSGSNVVSLTGGDREEALALRESRMGQATKATSDLQDSDAGEYLDQEDQEDQIEEEEREEQPQTQDFSTQRSDINKGTPGAPHRPPPEISREMAAVLETLTARERKVMQAIIDWGGRITQAEIRYETRIPKSSLTGILASLERRKLVTKKEWGRTNVIELSEWFLSIGKGD